MSHSKLLIILESIPKNELPLKWLRKYVVSGKQIATINGARSRPFEVESGVTKGPVVGSLLFLLFINIIFHEIAFQN